MRIDAHQHFWHYNAQRDSWITPAMSAIARDFGPADLEPLLKASRFDGAITVEAAASLDRTRALLNFVARSPFLVGFVGWVDLFAPDLGDVLDELSANPLFVGVRVGAQDEPDDFLTRDAVVSGISEVGKRNKPFDILIRERQLPAAIELVTRLPNQLFVLDHIAKPRIREGISDPWDVRIRELARRPTVMCKGSGLVTEADWTSWRYLHFAPYLDATFDAFGPDRLMFGSDWPVCTLAASYERVVEVIDRVTSTLSPSERDAIFGGTAARAYAIRERN